MREKENLERLNPGGRDKNSSMSFNTECHTRCEIGQVRYFANWKFGGGSKNVF